jgi:hypothetical protein
MPSTEFIAAVCTEACDKLLAVRDKHGISYFTCPVRAKPSSLGPIIDKLAGT